jgi:hypothetical protein
VTDPIKPPSLHDILSAAGDLNTLKPQPLRVLCNALIAFAFEAQRRMTDAEAREQATYLAFAKAKADTRKMAEQLAAEIEDRLARRRRTPRVAEPAKRVRGAATTALLRKRRKGKAK